MTLKRIEGVTLWIRDVDLSNVAVLFIVLIGFAWFPFDGHDGVNDSAVRQEINDGLSVILESILSITEHITLEE